jgi:Protein of unknown function (DUF4242)
MPSERLDPYRPPSTTTDQQGRTMPKFVIERELPGAGLLTADEVHTVAVKSNEVLSDMAPRAQWVTSYVTSDKVYCVYIAEDEVALREHGERVGVPVSAVNEITSVLDPTTGE